MSKIVKIKHAQAQEAEEAKAKNDRMNEPLADNTIRKIDSNDNDIDQDTRDACNLYNTMFYTPEKNELWDEQLDLGVNVKFFLHSQESKEWNPVETFHVRAGQVKIKNVVP